MWIRSGLFPRLDQPARGLPALPVIPCLCGALRVGWGVGGVGRARQPIMAAVRGLPPNSSKPYLLGGISNTISVHCFLVVMNGRPIPRWGSSQLLWWERRGVGGRQDLGFISPGCGSAAPGSLSSEPALSCRSPLGLGCRGAWPRRAAPSCGAELPSGPWRYLLPPLAEEGLVFGERGWLSCGRKRRTGPGPRRTGRPLSWGEKGLCGG